MDENLASIQLHSQDEAHSRFGGGLLFFLHFLAIYRMTYAFVFMIFWPRTGDIGPATLDSRPGTRDFIWEKIRHESQKAKKNGNGSLELSFRIAGLDEIKRWILSLGPEAVVIKPEQLKEMVRKDLSKNLAQYSKSPVSINLMKEIRAVWHGIRG